MKYLAILLASVFFFGCPSSPSDDNTNVGKTETPKRDYVWSLDTMFYNVAEPVPNQVYINCIWGASPRDVWAVGQSDVGSGRLWHYNGDKWTPRIDRPRNGFDDNKGFIVNPFAVTGFDSTNIFFACDRSYTDPPYSDSAIVLKWNGFNWTEVPWLNGKRAYGGFDDIKPQANTRLWGITTNGVVAYYENGFLKEEPKFLESKINDLYTIAPLDNGEVYINFLRDSIENQRRVGTITKLYRRNINTEWSLIENKFIVGADYDENGLGRGIWSVGNKLFTDNRGFWERKSTGWNKQMSIFGFGGTCTISENNIWIYFRQELWHYNGKDWKQITIPQLQNYPGGFLYGSGWSNNKEIFLSLHHNSKTYIVHGR